MSILKNSGLKRAAIATERGWETPDGKVMISSRNLLSNRVARGFATPEEFKRWSQSQLIEIEDRHNKVLSTLETNEVRLAGIIDAFNKANAEAEKSGDVLIQIAFHQRKIEHLKVVGQYEKSFKASRDELAKLNSNKEKIQTKLDSILSIVPSLVEKKSEQKIVPAPKQENESNKSVQPAQITPASPEKKRKKPGPKSKAQKLAEAAEAERIAAEAAAKLGGGYPVPEVETID